MGPESFTLGGACTFGEVPRHLLSSVASPERSWGLRDSGEDLLLRRRPNLGPTLPQGVDSKVDASSAPPPCRTCRRVTVGVGRAPASLASARRIDPGVRQEVHHAEVAGRPAVEARQGRTPEQAGEERVGVAPEQSDEHVGDDPTPDRPEGQAVGDELVLWRKFSALTRFSDDDRKRQKGITVRLQTVCFWTICAAERCGSSRIRCSAASGQPPSTPEWLSRRRVRPASTPFRPCPFRPCPSRRRASAWRRGRRRRLRR